MDWANERYIRIYIRDTLTWKRMRFEGQTVFMHVARKLDRMGRLPLDGMEPAEALSILTDVPEDFAATGFERLLDPQLKVFILVAGVLVAPNWVEAQEAKASPAQRQRESREKRKEQLAVTAAADTLHDVTSRDGPVTRSREVSRGVTPSLAEPSLAEPAEPPPRDPHTDSTSQLLIREHAKRYEQRRCASPTKGKAYFDAVRTAAAWVDQQAARDRLPVERVVSRTLDGLFASAKRHIVGDWGMRFLGADCAEFYSPPTAAPTAAYHAPLQPRVDDGPAVTYDEAMAADRARSS